MKFLSGVAIVALLVLSPGARAETADDEYVSIYNLIQQGDALIENGQLAPALTKYTLAQSDLKHFQEENPDWNTQVISFRFRYLAAKIAMISSEIQAAPTTPTNAPLAQSPASAPVRPPAVVVAPAPPPVNNSDEIVRQLQEQLREANADRATLQARLKEALAAQPAAEDPREFYEAETQILQLQKENELLKVSQEQSRESTNATAMKEAQHELADAHKQMAALTAANAALLADNAALRVRVKTPAAADADTLALREENAILKKQVAELKKPAAAGDMELKLHEAQAQIAALESDKEVLDLENTALEMRMKQTPGGVPPLPPGAIPAADAAAERIKELEAERDALQVRLDLATSQDSGKSKKQSAQLAEANRQLAGLQARIEILEAHPEPYTQDELALLSKSEGTMLVAAVHRSGRRSVKELSPASVALLADAKKDVANQDYVGAEAKYLEILKSNDKNPAVLTDLASIQVNLNHDTDAEKNIKAALALDPDNDYSLFVLGRLKLAQAKYDDALNALSRAAQINPNDAEIQNNLGVALSEKGLRVPAEAALRKAVQIDPGCADAHANLAFVYITQKPPLVELARWHYEKALAAGHPHNSAIEKLISGTGSPGDSTTP